MGAVSLVFGVLVLFIAVASECFVDPKPTKILRLTLPGIVALELVIWQLLHGRPFWTYEFFTFFGWLLVMVVIGVILGRLFRNSAKGLNEPPKR